MIRFTLTAVALLGLSPAHAADTRGILVVDDWGVYSATADRRVADPDATTGQRTVSRDFRLLERTRHICAQLGTRFGIRYHLRDDVPANALTVFIDVEHPPIVNTRGALQSHDGHFRQVPAHTPWYEGWIFSEPRELVAGEWRIIIKRGGAIDIDEAFDVRTTCAPPIS